MENEKKRGKNFTENEKSLLIDLILPYKNIIENIKTDGTTNKHKDAVWNDILKMYNSQQMSGIRSFRQIKSVYDVCKRNARKEKSDSRVELYKTGGGCNLSTLSNATEKVMGILGDRLEPLHNTLDCDSDYLSTMHDNNTSMVTENEEYIIETINEEDLLNDDMFDEEPKKINPEILTSEMHGNKKVKSFQSIQPVTADIENAHINKNIPKPHTSKKVFESLQLLTTKHLTVAEGKEKVRDDLNSLAYKKSKLKLEIAEKEKNIITLREKTEIEKSESELRQSKLKEQILESELRQNKIKEQILSKQLINL